MAFFCFLNMRAYVSTRLKLSLVTGVEIYPRKQPLNFVLDVCRVRIISHHFLSIVTGDRPSRQFLTLYFSFSGQETLYAVYKFSTYMSLNLVIRCSLFLNFLFKLLWGAERGGAKDGLAFHNKNNQKTFDVIVIKI